MDYYEQYVRDNPEYDDPNVPQHCKDIINSNFTLNVTAEDYKDKTKEQDIEKKEKDTDEFSSDFHTESLEDSSDSSEIRRKQSKNNETEKEKLSYIRIGRSGYQWLRKG